MDRGWTRERVDGGTLYTNRNMTFSESKSVFGFPVHIKRVGEMVFVAPGPEPGSKMAPGYAPFTCYVRIERSVPKP